MSIKFSPNAYRCRLVEKKTASKVNLDAVLKLVNKKTLLFK
jgi:hypothetical protein